MNKESAKELIRKYAKYDDNSIWSEYVCGNICDTMIIMKVFSVCNPCENELQSGICINTDNGDTIAEAVSAEEFEILMKCMGIRERY